KVRLNGGRQIARSDAVDFPPAFFSALQGKTAVADRDGIVFSLQKTLFLRRTPTGLTWSGKLPYSCTSQHASMRGPDRWQALKTSSRTLTSLSSQAVPPGWGLRLPSTSQDGV